MTGDPRADPRAHDLLTADPGVVNLLVIVFKDLARQAQVTADGLRGADGDATWSGAAADAFRNGLGKLPEDLGKVTSSYQEAADALNGYEGQLSQVKSAFQSIASQLESAHAQLGSAQSQLAGAQSALSTAAKAAAATPSPLSAAPPLVAPLTGPIPMSSPLYTAVNGASGAVQNAQGEIATLSSQGFRLLDEFEAARNAAKGKVSSASHVPPHRSFWDHFLHDVGNWMSAAGHFLVDVGKGIFNSVTGTLGAFENFVNDPTLANFGKLASDVAIDASIVVLAAAAPEALGLLGAAELTAEGAVVEGGAGLAGTLASLAAPAETVYTGAQVAKAGADLLQGHYADFSVDAVFLGIPSGADAANAVGAGERAAEQAAGNAEALQTYKFFADHGFTPGEAMSLMSDGEVNTVLHGVTNLGDRAEVASATQSATQTAAQAAKTAARVGAPVAYATDSIKDKSQENMQAKVGDILHPPPATSSCP
jgi:hypothetical protein